MPRSHGNAEKTETGSSWGLLPVEVRLLIVENISRQKCPGWASCAAVCKEWQAIIEPQNFHRLTLRASCVEEFSNMVIRQRVFVRHICLNVELPRYSCRSCQQSESYSYSSRNSFTVSGSVLKLFSVLSTWQPTGCLILELNAYSPSDSEHWFKNYHFGLEHEDAGGMVQQQESIITRWHDPDHGWVDGQQVKTPCAAAILRLFSAVCMNLPESPPEVPAVTGFVIRRQLRRQITPAVLRILWQRLPRLETVVYEPWCVWRGRWKTTFEKEIASMIQDGLSSHVRTVSMFEDFNDQLALALQRDTAYSSGIDTSSSASLMLVGAFVSRSRNFERLYISFMIDAQQFFKSCQPSFTWPDLKSLTLTSSILSQTAPHKEISALLLDASVAALKMPQLETMVFWNSIHGEACAFTYQRDRASKHATLTWRGTWDLELSNDVIQSWQEVASDSYHLRIKNERVQQALIHSHGDAIHYLCLPAGIIDPVSLWQIRQEGMMQRMA